jgi:phosphoribosyl-AMP cyclohydrolase
MRAEREAAITWSRGDEARNWPGRRCITATFAANSLLSYPVILSMTQERDVNGPDFQKSDLIPVIAQDEASGDVLMLAYMNAEAYAETLQTGRVCYYSRSRDRLWRKGEESGNVQEVKAIYFDCDADTLLIKVNQIGGAACHEGYRSCFFRQVVPGATEPQIVGQRVFDPQQVYKKN